MNDLMTKSFMSYVDLKKAAMKDIEAGGDETELTGAGAGGITDERLRGFFQEAEAVKEEMAAIRRLELARASTSSPRLDPATGALPFPVPPPQLGPTQRLPLEAGGCRSGSASPPLRLADFFAFLPALRRWRPRLRRRRWLRWRERPRLWRRQLQRWRRSGYGGGGRGDRRCYKYGEEGHMARDCSQGGGGGGGYDEGGYHGSHRHRTRRTWRGRRRRCRSRRGRRGTGGGGGRR